MMHCYKHDSVTWVDLEHPTREDVRQLIEDYDIDPIAAEELLNPTHRSKVDVRKDYIYLILHFPSQFNPKRIGSRHDIEEVDFIIGRNFIITARYGVVDAMHEFSKMFETDSMLHRQHFTKHAGYVFYHMIRSIYKSIYGKVEDIKSVLSGFEDDVFEGKEKEMVFELSKMNRVILYFKEALLLHKEILMSFERAGQKLFEQEFAHYLEAIIGEYTKVDSTLNSAKEYLAELRQTNDSLLSAKQNGIMKTLTVVNFIVLPLTLITGLLGMNTEDNPLVGHDHDFLIISIVMILLAVTMSAVFKRKKWL